eukprot:m.670904 g.670904  ORF g.670904 m.670904 type:complete len:54 (+) comp58529_c0_seq12:222-383(+)
MVPHCHQDACPAPRAVELSLIHEGFQIPRKGPARLSVTALSTKHGTTMLVLSH